MADFSKGQRGRFLTSDDIFNQPYTRYPDEWPLLMQNEQITDTDRINFLDAETKRGSCPGLINDDNGHWAVSYSGMQNVVTGKRGKDVSTTFFVEAKEWRNTVRAAIDAQIREAQKQKPVKKKRK